MVGSSSGRGVVLREVLVVFFCCFEKKEKKENDGCCECAFFIEGMVVLEGYLIGFLNFL